MPQIKNWEVDWDKWIGYYERDDRWQIWVISECVGGERKWYVQLFFGDHLRETIGSDIDDRKDALNKMVA